MSPSFEKWTEEDEQKILQELEAGKWIDDIVKELNRSNGAVEVRRKQNGETLEEVARKN